MAIALTLVVGGQTLTAFARPTTLHIQDQLTSRNTFNVELWDQTLADFTRPIVGQPVLLLDTNGTTKLFAGSVDEIDEQLITGGRFNYLDYILKCVDYNQICDRFLVAESFINPAQTLSDIVNFIVANTLLGEGISNAGVNTGPVIAETKLFNYKTVTQVFNELQTLSNFVWWIDYDKVLNFVPRTGTPSGITLDTTNTISCTVMTSRAVGPYRNVQYVRAGTAETAVRTEVLTGDGQRKSYDVTYGIARGPVKGNPPVILLNGVSQTVGLHGIDTGKNFYYTVDSSSIVRDDSGAPLSSADALSVTYVGRYPSVVEAQIDAEVAARMAIEGGTGVYQSLKTDRNLNDILAQTNLAKSLLVRYGFIPVQLKIVTDVIGIRSGQLITCNFPLNNVTGNFIVQSVMGDDQQGAFMRYSVTLVNG